MGNMENEKKNIVRRYLGKRVTIKSYLDYGYYIDGDPQYNRVAIVNGVIIYDAHNNINSVDRSVYDALRKYGSVTGQFTREPNGQPGYMDVTYTFVPSEEVLKNL